MSTTPITNRKLANPYARAWQEANNFSATARHATKPKEVLDAMVGSLATIFGGRASYYTIDRFGNLTINTANNPQVINESHVWNTPPEGPLAAVIENEGFAYVPSILQSQEEYLVLDSKHNLARVKAHPMNLDVTYRYIAAYGTNFSAENNMDMLFGCLSVPGTIFGAFKIDAFPSGRSILPHGMAPEELLEIAFSVSNSASLSLAIFSDKMEEQRLARAYQALSQQATRFVHDMKHDVRGKLGLIAMRIEYALSKRTEQERLGQLEKLARLQSVIHEYNGSLEMYTRQLEQGKFEIAIEPKEVDLKTIFDPLSDQGLELSIESKLPIILTDRKAVEVVLNGLIDNAIKYGNGGAIKVSCRVTEDGNIEISVSDNGYGITPENLQNIFEGGVRTHPEIQGSGYGLAGFKKIVDRLKGDIWAESEGPGQGSTFKFTLPVEVEA